MPAEGRRPYEANACFEVVDRINLNRRLYTALIMVSTMCLAIVGIYFLLLLFNSGSLTNRYTYRVNHTVVYANDMANLVESIELYFPKPAFVEVYNSGNVKVESFLVTPGDLQAKTPAGFNQSLDRSDIYSRLKMYAQPGKLDLLFRKIYVGKADFSLFIADLLTFDEQSLKDSGKTVFLR